jgi:hypothetical protein
VSFHKGTAELASVDSARYTRCKITPSVI